MKRTEKLTSPLVSSIAILNQVDIICDKFESSWKSGNRPRISDYLPLIEQTAESALLMELVQLDFIYRQGLGETPAPGDYTTQFPQHADLINRLLSRELPRVQPDEEDIGSGRRIGRFELVSLLGRGGFGVVWKARDPKLKRFVALKLPLPHRQGVGGKQAFLREARAAAQLVHPNIVRILEIGEEDEQTYIVSEFVEGSNFQEWLDRNHPDFEQSARFCLKLARALEHAHAHGIVHRDIKPGNVLISTQGELYLTDFGIAKNQADSVLSTVVQSGRIIGTPAYMSPEQAAGRPDRIDHRSDVYSLGVMLYQLLTGTLPFVGQEPAVVIRQILQTAPQVPTRRNKDIPRPLEIICLKAMEKSPADRFQKAGELAADLERHLAGEPIVARPVSPLLRCSRWVQMNRMLALLLATVVLGATGILAFFVQKAHALPPGHQRVSITTDPPGAQVVFVPLNETTLEPKPDQLIQCEGVTPLTVPLAPGNYLVVAWLDQERFHEVYRYVPTLEEADEVRNGRSVTVVYAFGRFKPLDDGSISLNSVKIRGPEAVEEMTLVPGTEDFSYEFENDPLSQGRHGPIPAFYISPCEYSLEEWKLFDPATWHHVHRRTWEILEAEELAETSAMRWDWFYSVSVAERFGKRLPTEAELLYAATALGKHKYPWGDALPPAAEQVTRFGPVGTPEFDCLKIPGQPGVYGLCSHVAEWTMTNSPRPASVQNSVRRYPVVFGGAKAVLEGDARVTAELRNPRMKAWMKSEEIKPGLGVRMVRSAKPRVKPEDF